MLISEYFVRHRVKVIFIMMIFSFFLVNGCSLKKRYVGINVYKYNWPKYSSGKKINLHTKVFDFEFTINKTKIEEEYLVEGIMDGSRGCLKSLDRLILHKSNFYLLIVQNHVIIDSVMFCPVGTDHTHKLPFKKKFKAGAFDSVYIAYYVTAGG